MPPGTIAGLRELQRFACYLTARPGGIILFLIGVIMSVHLYGHGDVYQEGQSNPSGTWTTSGENDNTLTYDENPQGPGGNDKTFQWTEPGAYYLSTDSLSKVEYTYEGIIDGKKTWRWKEWARGSTNDPWPTQPTATGTVTKSP